MRKGAARPPQGPPALPVSAAGGHALSPSRMARLLIVLLLLAPLPARAAEAAEEDWAACRRAILQVEPTAGTPPGLLLAIALVEAGRAHPRTGVPQPWPWAWNAEGAPGFGASRAEAVAAVAGLRAAGVRSVDVGCMQVNLLWHGAAFASLEQAFDPLANIRYAAQFLRELRARHGDWPAAIAHYHSAEEVRGDGYLRRVVLARLSAAWAGASAAPVAIPLPRPTPGVRALCPPGRLPVLVLRRTGGVRAGIAPDRIALVCQGLARARPLSRPDSAPAPG